MFFHFVVTYFRMNRQILAKRLAEKKVNQQQMASDIGMRPQRLSDMLSGRLQGWKYRSRICRYLGLREEDLFDEDGTQESGRV
jgi:DNA-binding XRE family transcriptional regulator